jgi:hypothetical protein
MKIVAVNGRRFSVDGLKRAIAGSKDTKTPLAAISAPRARSRHQRCADVDRDTAHAMNLLIAPLPAPPSSRASRALCTPDRRAARLWVGVYAAAQWDDECVIIVGRQPPPDAETARDVLFGSARLGHHPAHSLSAARTSPDTDSDLCDSTRGNADLPRECHHTACHDPFACTRNDGLLVL